MIWKKEKDINDEYERSDNPRRSSNDRTNFSASIEHLCREAKRRR